jgi:hypothetical protein
VRLARALSARLFGAFRARDGPDLVVEHDGMRAMRALEQPNEVRLRDGEVGEPFVELRQQLCWQGALELGRREEGVAATAVDAAQPALGRQALGSLAKHVLLAVPLHAARAEQVAFLALRELAERELAEAASAFDARSLLGRFVE